MAVIITYMTRSRDGRTRLQHAADAHTPSDQGIDRMLYIIDLCIQHSANAVGLNKGRHPGFEANTRLLPVNLRLHQSS